jgi:hypothetical protein
MENKVSREDLEKALNNINEPLNLDIMKGKAAMIGEVRVWNGKKFKKQANGKWVEVSEKGMTKKEHEEKKLKEISAEINRARLKSRGRQSDMDKINLLKEQKDKVSSKYKHLSDKEYDDSDFEEKKEKVEKSLQDHFNIINAPLNFNKEEEIKKSDVYYAIGENNSSQSPIGKFKKKGSELKAMAATKKAKYETKKVIIEASKEEMMSKLKEAGVECIEGEYDCKFNYNYETIPQSTRDLIYKYKNLSYECEGINKDIKALNIIIKHCEDNKMYDVTARQLISLDDE